jgi:broad specificity polyphosphatase/5'/3'-nucleotidase SurE
LESDTWLSRSYQRKIPEVRRFGGSGLQVLQKDAGPGTDFYAVAQGRVSITPLDIDLTAHRLLNDVEQWLKSPS